MAARASTPRRAATAALLATAIVLPAVLSDFTIGLVALWLPLVVLAISLDVLWGENRIVSFGHGAFFAAGGYLAGLLLRGPQADTTGANYALLGEETGRSTFQAAIDTLSSPQVAGIPPLAFVLPVVLCGLVGLLVGAVIFRIGSVEVYAPLITLGVGVIAATVFLKLAAIGGSNGLSGIPSYTRDIAGGSNVSTYYFNAIWLAAVYVLYAWFRRSRAGRRWRASGDDPIRLDALGTDTRRLRAIGFGASTALAGLAGALYVGASGFMSADTATVVFSVQALIWLAVGGPGSLFAPLVGVLAIQLGQHELSEQLQDTWQLLLGGLLILTVLVAPQGLTGLAKTAYERLLGSGAPNARPPRSPFMTPRALRIVCTNDFLGSLAPMRTSYGTLPGGHALQRTVAELRRGQPTLWADAGDFSHGGPLSTATGGVSGFEAAAQLGFDVATVGNHEFDWGPAHLDEQRRRLPFELICANVDIGLAPATVLPTEAGPVGFVGLTHPSLDAFTPHAPKPEAKLEPIVAEHAGELRAQGAVAVVALIHFGVSWSVADDGAHVPDPTPVLELCGPFHEHVDAVVLGHTLGRWADVVDGVPYAQPWAFGAEVGVIDLDLEGHRHAVALRPVDAEPAVWSGAGRAAIGAAEQAVVGEVPATLTIDFAGDISLADFAAEALRVASDASGAVVPVVGMHQPAIEGVMYRWPAGPVTEADLARLWPWTDDRAFVAEVSREELETILSFQAPEPWLAWGAGRAPGDLDGSPTIVIPRDYVDWAAVQISELVGHEIDWRPTNVRVRDALRDALVSGKVAAVSDDR